LSGIGALALNETKGSCFQMRSTYRKALALPVVILAMSAIGVASASAAECPGTGEGVALCVEGKKQTTNAPFVAEKKAGTEGHMYIEGEGWGFECKKAAVSGEFNATGLSLAIEKTTIAYSECKVNSSVKNEEKCQIKSFTAEISGSFIGHETGSVVFTGSKSGETWAEITVTGAGCTIVITKAPITGKQTCRLPAVGTELVTHEFQCGSEGSNLKFEGRSFGLQLTESMKLVSAKSWSLQRS
jgi:hypothetical protein